MSRRAWAIFGLVEVVGLACAWLQHAPSAASSFLWGAGFLLLFPGDLLGAWIMERLFWQPPFAGDDERNVRRAHGRDQCPAVVDGGAGLEGDPFLAI